MNAMELAKRLLRHRSFKVGLFIFAVVLSSFTFAPHHASALTVKTPGREWNVGWFHGYFNNELEYCGSGNGNCGSNGPGPYCNFQACGGGSDVNDVLPHDYSCGANPNQAIPVQCVAGSGSDNTRVHSLISFLQGENGSGNPRRHTGSGFIYNGLVGNKARDPKNRGVSGGQWSGLETLIDAELADGQISISWDMSVTTWYNTYSSWLPDGNADVTYYCGVSQCGGGGGGQTGEAIVFFDHGNNPLFVLFRSCANPGGEMNGLPPLNNPASYAASSTVDTSTLTLGQTATFKNYIDVSDYSSPDNVGWQVQRTVNGSPVGGPTTGTLATSGNGLKKVETDTYTDVSDPPGTVVCDDFSIDNPPPDSEVTTRNSSACTTVLAQPYLTVSGNDVWAGSDFNYAGVANPCSTVRNSNIKTWVSASGYGSFGQYAVMARGTITGMGSNGSSGNANNTGFTFANTPVNGKLGDSTRCVPDYYNAVGTGGTGLGGSVDPDTLTSKIYYRNGNLTINGGGATGQVGGGVHAAIVVNGTVTIKGDVTYPGTYSSQTDIPSLWVIANGNINIQDNVGTITGFYVAEGKNAGPTSGVVQTCVKPGSTTTYNPLTTGVCNTTLTVKGALLAKQVYWQRTNGTVAAGQPPAEQIQFSPELFLESPLMNTSPPGGLSTNQFTQLPPVY
ncbi:MAG TPA: hypothetical protein VGS28_01295 [Candidatus Saccharimonadales bacterium]|nr:hypothetical protein [Candidatus Saccharimonadales bacterium]